MAGKCFTCKPGDMNCALMGYHADASPGLENNEISSSKFSDLIGNKYFLTTGKEYPFCRKYFSILLLRFIHFYSNNKHRFCSKLKEN